MADYNRRFQVGDTVILARGPGDRPGVGNPETFNVWPGEFGKSHKLIDLYVYSFTDGYLIKKTEPGRTGTWVVLDTMLDPIWSQPKDPVNWRVQIKDRSFVRPFERGADLEAMVAEAVGGSWEGPKIYRGTTLIRGERNGEPFTLMRID